MIGKNEQQTERDGMLVVRRDGPRAGKQNPTKKNNVKSVLFY